jgi:hypothetical protein
MLGDLAWFNAFEQACFPSTAQKVRQKQPWQMPGLMRKKIANATGRVFVSDLVAEYSGSDWASRAQQRTILEVPNSAPSLHPKYPLPFLSMICLRDRFGPGSLEALSFAPSRRWMYRCRPHSRPQAGWTASSCRPRKLGSR